MQIKSLLLCVFLCIFSLCVFADELIIEPDRGRTPILNAMYNAKKSIHLVMYGLTDTQLINTIIQAKNRGKDVKVLLEPHPYRASNENELAIARLKRAEVNVEWPNPEFTLTHQKVLIIDDHYALIMTFNFTHATFEKERNFALLIEDPDMIKEIQQVFTADAKHQTITVHQENLVWSPNNSREKLLQFIHSAKSNINIYAEGLSDYQIVGAIAKAARTGIKVRVLMSTYGAPTKGRKMDYLRRAAVDIRYSKNPLIHAKMILTDNTQAIIGSTNLTKPSLDKNRELSIRTANPLVIHQLTATFNQDWQQAGFVDTGILKISRLLRKHVQRIAREWQKSY